jgi:hypothetical protein
MVGGLNSKGFDLALAMQCFGGHHQIKTMMPITVHVSILYQTAFNNIY